MRSFTHLNHPKYIIQLVQHKYSAIAPPKREKEGKRSTNIQTPPHKTLPADLLVGAEDRFKPPYCYCCGRVGHDHSVIAKRKEKNVS